MEYEEGRLAAKWYALRRRYDRYCYASARSSAGDDAMRRLGAALRVVEARLDAVRDGFVLDREAFASFV